MWNRRQFAGHCIAVAAISSIGRPALAQGSGAATPAIATPAMMTRTDCIDSCLRSHGMCIETARYCTEKGGLHAAAVHLALLLDCAEICQTAANSLLRSSPQHGVICNACAQLCDACAKDCESFAGDEQMARCASTCRNCARDCRDMINMPL
jgi:hypothetical protein